MQRPQTPPRLRPRPPSPELPGSWIPHAPRPSRTHGRRVGVHQLALHAPSCRGQLCWQEAAPVWQRDLRPPLVSFSLWAPRGRLCLLADVCRGGDAQTRDGARTHHCHTRVQDRVAWAPQDPLCVTQLSAQRATGCLDECGRLSGFARMLQFGRILLVCRTFRRSGYLMFLIASCLCMKLPDRGIVWGVVKWGLFEIRLKKQNPS